MSAFEGSAEVFKKLLSSFGTSEFGGNLKFRFGSFFAGHSEFFDDICSLDSVKLLKNANVPFFVVGLGMSSIAGMVISFVGVARIFNALLLTNLASGFWISISGNVLFNAGFE